VVETPSGAPQGRGLVWSVARPGFGLVRRQALRHLLLACTIAVGAAGEIQGTQLLLLLEVHIHIDPQAVELDALGVVPVLGHRGPVLLRVRGRRVERVPIAHPLQWGGDRRACAWVQYSPTATARIVHALCTAAQRSATARLAGVVSYRQELGRLASPTWFE
jgi:hypothetical protein